MNINKIFLSLVFFIWICLSPVFAQTITLYDQPAANAKNLGTVDLTSGIIPIFTPNTGDWMKVADPRNGNVGWVKQSDIKNAKGSVNVNQKVISTGTNNPQPSTQPFMFGFPPNMSKEQMQEIVKNAQIEQQKMQEKFQGVVKQMNELIQEQWQTLNATGMFPIMQPAAQPANGKPAVATPTQVVPTQPMSPQPVPVQPTNPVATPNQNIAK